MRELFFCFVTCLSYFGLYISSARQKFRYYQTKGQPLFKCDISNLLTEIPLKRILSAYLFYIPIQKQQNIVFFSCKKDIFVEELQWICQVWMIKGFALKYEGPSNIDVFIQVPSVQINKYLIFWKHSSGPLDKYERYNEE